MAFNRATIKAAPTPGMSKNKWKSKMLIEIGANNIKAKATHFFDKSMAPMITSNMPTNGKI